MTPLEQQQLLALFDRTERWCRHAEARDRLGQPVTYDDEAAVAWDLTGALCHLFGWERAAQLFCHLQSRLDGTGPTGCPQQRSTGPAHDPQLRAMAALQEFNDNARTNFEAVVALIRSAP
jgi:hypothetical protein